MAIAALGIGIAVSMLRGPSQAAPTATIGRPLPAHPVGWTRRSLAPVPNPDPDAPAQLARLRPYRVATTPDGEKAYVTLAGREIHPGSDVVVIDVRERRAIRRLRVGSSPYGLARHPSGRWVVVTNRFSNFLSVIDTSRDTVVSEIPVPFYSEDVVFSPDGTQAYLSNFQLDQVLIVDLAVGPERLDGRVRELGFDHETFVGATESVSEVVTICQVCGWRSHGAAVCPRCGSTDLVAESTEHEMRVTGGVHTILRARCGTSECHLYPAGGYVAGPDLDESFLSAVLHAFPDRPEASPLLQASTSIRHGGWADRVDGRHHAGDVVFEDPPNDTDYARLREWIATGTRGPGIAVGQKPRDMALAADGRTLYVANTGSLDVSVVDLVTLRETSRIFTRSPVNDLVLIDGRLVLATLGVGSGHPKARHPGRESLDPRHPEAEFTLFRDPETGQPYPLERQQPLGPYDEVDGTAQEKFRDITNDVVVLDPATPSVAAYDATDRFTRYTSDSFEAMSGDIKGDVPADLMKVVGAFPEQIAQVGDRLYITMSGTFQVQEWEIDLSAEPSRRLVPGRVFETGFKPVGIAPAGDGLIVVDHLGDSVTFIDLAGGETRRLLLDEDRESFPANDFERGEFFVQTSVFSVDQDESCVHCHYRDASDGQRWSVSQVMGQSRAGDERTGGSREVPDIRNLFLETPFFVEGTLSMDEALTMMMEHNPLVDFQGRTPSGDFSGVVATAEEVERASTSADTIVVATGRGWERDGVRLADLIARRELFFRQTSSRYFGAAYGFRDMQRVIGDYQGGEPRLLPNPIDPDDSMVRRGRAIFESPEVGCAGCHPAPAFTDKVTVYNQNKAFRPLVTAAARDNVHTLISADRLDAIMGFARDWDPTDEGRIEEHEGFFVAPSLRGLWARPHAFLHHGRAVGLREVVATPDHPALRPRTLNRRDPDRPAGRERGLNELDGLIDTHGTTSHLSVWEFECLLKYLVSIE
ncbi:MAG: hypothetical protein CL471_04275 [Acidobacteria bacterium]|nr:hypothetical protein [Acidobacteriota bacterium]